MLCPHEVLFRSPPSYSHMLTFGCLCYPNRTSITPHKFAPCSFPCLFLGYPANHWGYRCLASLQAKSSSLVMSLLTSLPFVSPHHPRALPLLEPTLFSPLLFPVSPPPTSSRPHSDVVRPISNSEAAAVSTGAPPITGSAASHPMTTWSKSGITKPRVLFSLNTVTSPVFPIPTTYRQALIDPHWRSAMLLEFNALTKNQTWELFLLLLF